MITTNDTNNANNTNKEHNNDNSFVVKILHLPSAFFASLRKKYRYIACIPMDNINKTIDFALHGLYNLTVNNIKVLEVNN